VVLLNLLGRVGWGDVPDELQGNVVLGVAVVMYLVEFVADKVPFFDSVWDAINLPIRTAVAGAIGAVYGSADELQGVEQAFATGGSGATAFLSAGIKMGLRLGINTSPEPASNIVASLLEDGLVGIVVFIALEHPVLSALIVALLLGLGIFLVILLAKQIRKAYHALRRHYGREPPPAAPT
jgi:hypothetical protein